MTDKEIIKALECCSNQKYISDCEKCKYFAFDCKDTLIEQALDLINRQQAEIERLKGWQDLLKAEKHSLIKAEAVKEFAERLKAVSHPYADTQMVFELQIDNLVKEMVGE